MDEKFYKSLVYPLTERTDEIVFGLINRVNAMCSTCKNRGSKSCELCLSSYDYSKIKEGCVTFKLTHYIPLISEKEG